MNEVVFIMSDRLPCCSLSTPVEILRRCRNPHCKSKISLKIVEQIDMANYLICLAMYCLTWKSIVDALIRAKRRGVIVRVVLNKPQCRSSRKQMRRLRVAGIDVKITDSAKQRLMHNKFCVIDVLHDEKPLVVNKHPLNGVLINGSMNWSMGGFNSNWENIQFSSDNHLKIRYKMAFDYIWNRIQ